MDFSGDFFPRFFFNLFSRFLWSFLPLCADDFEAMDSNKDGMLSTDEAIAGIANSFNGAGRYFSDNGIKIVCIPTSKRQGPKRPEAKAAKGPGAKAARGQSAHGQ
jgi:hypothetical protein